MGSLISGHLQPAVLSQCRTASRPVRGEESGIDLLAFPSLTWGNSPSYREPGINGLHQLWGKKVEGLKKKMKVMSQYVVGSATLGLVGALITL